MLTFIDERRQRIRKAHEAGREEGREEGKATTLHVLSLDPRTAELLREDPKIREMLREHGIEPPDQRNGGD